MWKQFVLRFTLAILMLFPLLWQSDLPFKGNSTYAIAQPYIFSIAGWETSQLFHSLGYRLKSLLGRGSVASAEEIKLVKEYFRLGDEVAKLQSGITRGSSIPGAEAQAEVGRLKARLAAIEQERIAYTDRVEAILGRQIKAVLAEEAISAFPSVEFKFGRLPFVLVTSPRYKIELKESVLLDPGLDWQLVPTIEQKVERLGVSALVEGIGGIATYPSLLPQGASLEQTLNDIAHEWLHQYLFFHPLGRRYGASYDMRTINETVADIAGREIGSRVYRLYQEGESKSEKKPVSEFDREMRQIRLKVDSLLAQGKIEEAERFMEESRQALAQRGYYIRRLNQAYFAFHGSYADTAASTSPAGEMLHALRQRSASLGQFLKAVAGITSYSDLEKLASGEAH